MHEIVSLCFGALCCVNAANKIIFGSGSRLIIEPSEYRLKTPEIKESNTDGNAVKEKRV